MAEKRVVVTGANRGIGYQTALSLARSGFSVIMACRDVERSLQAAASIRELVPGATVGLLALDLGSLKSIDAFIAEYRRAYGSLDILVNNAGISSSRTERTTDGYETIVGVNFIGPYYLTMKLLPLFAEGGPRRVVNLSSSIYPYGDFSFSRVNRYRWTKAYAVSKYLMLLFTLALPEARAGVQAYAVDPGIVKTGIMFTGAWYDRLIDLMLAPFYVSPARGAETVAYLCAAEAVPPSESRLFRKGEPARVARRHLRDRKKDQLIPYFDALLGLR